MSGLYERKGNELVQWGDCNEIPDFTCFGPRLSGGFPFAFIFDSPGISVENRLSVGEDDFRGYPFLMDVWFYWASLVFSGIALKNLRQLS
jgi:hypothetical protein